MIVLYSTYTCRLVIFVVFAQSFFSAGNMKILIEEVLESSAVSLINTNDSADCLIYSLLLGEVCLVPYPWFRKIKL